MNPNSFHWCQTSQRSDGLDPLQGIRDGEDFFEDDPVGGLYDSLVTHARMSASHTLQVRAKPACQGMIVSLEDTISGRDRVFNFIE